MVVQIAQFAKIIYFSFMWWLFIYLFYKMSENSENAHPNYSKPMQTGWLKLLVLFDQQPKTQ